MDKPEDVPQDIWDAADITYDEARTCTIVLQSVEVIARAILSAQSQAYIDAASIAEEVRDDYQRRIESLPDNHYKTPYRLHSKNAADQVRAAILQRKEEIGRN